MISPKLTNIVTFGVCMPNQILRPWTPHKSKRHTSNFAKVTYRSTTRLPMLLVELNLVAYL